MKMNLSFLGSPVRVVLLAVTLFVAGFVSTCALHAANPELNLSAPSSLDYDDPIVLKGDQTTGFGSALPALPASVAVGSFGFFTNCNFRIVRNSEVTITLRYRAQLTNNSASSNQVFYVDLSPDGRLWATNTPFTFSHTPTATTTNTYALQWTIPSTNFGANAYARIRGMTNAGSTGNGSVFPSNVVVNTWRPATNRR